MQGGACKMKSLRLFIQLSRPIYILMAILLYALGVGIAHYLSGQINWLSFFLDLAWVVFLLLGFQYLNEYFYLDSVYDERSWWYPPFSGGSGAIGTSRLPRQVALWAGLACLTVTAALTILIYQNQELNLTRILMLGLLLLCELIFTLPPPRLITSGYGELIMSLIMVGIIPALAYLLQGHDLHRLLIMVSFPLVFLFLAMLLAIEFPAYASDINHGKQPILVRIGWQRGMLLHNILVLSSFVILGVAFIFGLPLSIGWPAIFVLPVGLFQIWMMNRIADGAKPNWDLLILIALSTFGLTTYVLTFSFWTH
jgi:1,4-dihydroxy-2-naphthoate octaprenyltransferase